MNKIKSVLVLVGLAVIVSTCTHIQPSALPTAIAPSGLISGFSPITDAHWTLDSRVFGNHNANLINDNGYSIKQIDNYTLRYEVRPGDLWDGDKINGNAGNTERSESWMYGTSSFFPTKTPLTVDYYFMIEPGAVHPSGADTWVLMGQIHGNDSVSPPVAVELSGEYLQVKARYGTVNSFTTVTAWKSTIPIVRGQYYHFRFETNNDNTANGYLRVWLDGVRIVNRTGAIGYNDSLKWSMGIYRYKASYNMAVRFSHVVINGSSIATSTPVPATQTPTETRTPIPPSFTPTLTATATRTNTPTITPSPTAICVPALDVWVCDKKP